MSGAVQMTREELKSLIADTAGEVVSKALAAAPKPTSLGASVAGDVQRARTVFAPDEPGINIARYLLSVGAASLHTLKSGIADPGFSLRWAQSAWGERCPVVEQLAMQSSSVETGGAWVPETFASELIPLLTPKSIIRQFKPEILGMSGTLRIGRLNQGATAKYVSEGVPPRATKQKTGNLQLTARKLIGILPISNDWLRRVVPGGDRMLRDNLVFSLRNREDIAFLRGDGLNDTPKGIRYQMLGSYAVNVNNTFNSVQARIELGKIKNRLEQANVPMERCAWLLSATTKNALESLTNGTSGLLAFPEMADGMLCGYPFGFTTNIPSNTGGGGNESEIYFVAFNEVVIGQELDIQSDVFSQGSYTDEDGDMQSLIDNDETAVRLISEHDILLKHDTAVSVGTACTWGA